MMAYAQVWIAFVALIYQTFTIIHYLWMHFGVLGNNHPNANAYSLWSIDCATCFSLANMKYSSLNIGLSLFLVPPFELHKKTTQVQVRSDQWSDI